MKIDILTLFPNIFSPLHESIVKRAQEKGIVKITIHDLRKWAVDKHGTVDDKPYGGGAGMVLMIQPIYDALESIKSESQIPNFETNPNSQTTNIEQVQNSKHKTLSKRSKTQNPKSKIVLLSPQGKVFNQAKAEELSKLDNLVLVCGHYEGFDQRIVDNLIDEEISIGDYVLTGGELPAMVLVDSVVRLIPGVLGHKDSLQRETHSKKGFIKHPVYTRPENFKGWQVPEVLLSGNPKLINEWKEKNSKKN